MANDYNEIEVVISEEKDADDKHLFKIQCDANQKEVIHFLGNLIDELKLEVFRNEWYSKDNSYVMYYYEPFCIDGFNYIASFEYSEEVENKIAFAKQIIADWVGKVNKLNKLLALTA